MPAITVFPIKPWTPEKISGMFIVSQRIRCEMKPAKDNCQTAALISQDLMRNNKLTFSSTRNLQFYRFQILKVFFLDFGFCRIDMNDILRKSDVKSRRQDQTVDQTELDNTSESEKNWANHKQCSFVFVSRAVQRVMLVGCEWWFSIHIFLQLRNLYPWCEPVPL